MYFEFLPAVVYIVCFTKDGLYDDAPQIVWKFHGAEMKNVNLKQFRTMKKLNENVSMWNGLYILGYFNIFGVSYPWPYLS